MCYFVVYQRLFEKVSNNQKTNYFKNNTLKTLWNFETLQTKQKYPFKANDLILVQHKLYLASNKISIAPGKCPYKVK